jgi:predicted dehydrogenase
MTLGLLIGYGSIGRRHGRIVSQRYDSVAIVDQSSEARKRAATDHPAANVVGDLEALGQGDWNWGGSTGIIATWGPSHFEIFNELVDRGVRRILCEKPFANSVSRCHEMMTRASREGVTFGVHHQRRYSGLADGLGKLAETHKLGEPTGVVIHGGAAGIVARGVHWIDLTTEIFGDPPAEVVSTGSSGTNC